MALGCGGSDPERSEPAPDPASGNPASSEPGDTGSDTGNADRAAEGTATPEEQASEGEGLNLSIEGWTDSLGAKAELRVSEGVSLVRLEIIGTGQRDVLMMDFAFDGLEDSWLPQREEVGLPGEAPHFAIAQIEGQPYHSQSGHIAVSLSEDGAISGSFEVAMVEDPVIPAGEPIVFEPGEISRVLSGTFSGQWELLCQSRLPGHRSLRSGGQFCDDLNLD